MHGRLKVRTSDEEKERKKKEQTLKVKAYRAAMTKIQAKRHKGEYDDEMLHTTTAILQRNPDVSTLWNIRRQCIEHKAHLLNENKEELQAACDDELSLTEQCLMVNPKSYCAWHHRCWILEHSPSANWEREMHLCNKYLKMDERNFHSWDYRRYIAAKSGVPKQQELDFCTEKIKVNFSNYSSWHYRSLLLPQLYSYEGEATPKPVMIEFKLKEELEMVLTAAFTDPNDSSAWFYQRWLLAHSRLSLDICAFRCDKKKAVLSFIHSTILSNAKVSLCDSNGETLLTLTDWRSLNKNNDAAATWIAALPADHAFNFETNYVNLILKIDIPFIQTKQVILKSHANSWYYFKPPVYCFNFSACVLKALQSQLESCNSLLEYEPDSKWTLLTTALLMRAIDCKQYHGKSLEYLQKLQQVDDLRKGYYKDLAAQWILEKCLTDWSQSNEVPAKLNLQNETQLTTLSHVQYLSIADVVLLPADMQEIGKKLNTFESIKL